MRRLSAIIFLIGLLCTFFGAQQAWASRVIATDIDNYQLAMQSIGNGQVRSALERLDQVKNPLLRKVALGELMTRQDTPYDFSQLSGFLSANPGWPGSKDIRLRAEERLPAGLSPTQLSHWFDAHPPLTLTGFDLMISALRATGKSIQARALVRERWVNGAFGSTEQTDFLKRYGGELTGKDHWRRLDRLLWDGTENASQRMLPLVGKNLAALAKARLSPTPRNLKLVPASLQHDPGLLLLKIKAARRDEANETAANLLAKQPNATEQDEAWWDERSIIARRYLTTRQFSRAYQLAAEHRLPPGAAMAEAEFLAGWIAFRFLQQPEKAMRHFKALDAISNFPISKARAAYWLGRCHTALGHNDQARAWYAKAAIYPTTFYGQLAQTEIEKKSVLTIRSPQLDESDREVFRLREDVRIIRLLQQIGEPRRAESFMLAASARATTLPEFSQLAQLANDLERYDLAVRIGKRAVQRNILLDNEAYPVPDYLMPERPEKALLLGLIRQESMFNSSITSPANAIGLTQLLPSTARALARELGLSFSVSRLTDPAYNLRLGSRYLADRIEQFDGSLILAIASYNAGPARVRQWLESIGDPREGRDPVDWVELIPVEETRNYVQRVLEATQIYRARLNKGAAKLGLRRDLQLGAL
jgi:soluble lytic murein transglycosylase